MRRFARILRRIGAVLLWTVVALCLVVTVLPFFLDRIYYRGPETAHFDGQRFHNPEGDAPEIRRISPGRIAGFLFGDKDRPQWPDHVEVKRDMPPARVEGQAMRVVWLGHATMLVQTQGLNILTDPIFSDQAGPLGVGPTRVAQPAVAFDDLPRIDLVIVSHNHYDHMDLDTLKRLYERDHPLIVTSLGNDAVIGGAGVKARALDWGQRTAVRPGIDVIVTRNHHWGSRWFADRNRALWSSFVVTLPGGNFFFAGDTGIGDGRWPAEAAAYGPIRLAGIPVGAFRFEPGQMGSDSHVGPRGAIQVWQGLGRPFAVPIHWGTFRLSWEGYRTPPDLLAAMLGCAGSGSGRFAGHALGEAIDVPAISAFAAAPAPDLAAIEACHRKGAFDRYR